MPITPHVKKLLPSALNNMVERKAIPRGWFRKFSRTKTVKIHRFDRAIFGAVKRVKAKLRKLLGKSVEIEHRGSTALGISGQGEVDLYLRVRGKKDFELAFEKLRKNFGWPGSYYPDEPRARFNYNHKGVKFEIMLVLQNAVDEVEGRLFFNYLKQHKDILKRYEELKLKYALRSKYEYQIAKHKFITKILDAAKRNAKQN